ncbi:recombinase RecA [Acholeplasma equirhinis]|uniref:recombinase RecA n=1 Tax=Acholeplasma equirhinis TaxID=555393 RepID=UPI00197AF4FD|nr:recombinase RecA [Acholeplasma equirhinis]MBN3490577.1 recombinase RecA [Acholeplasma equirhinis]
MSDNKKQQALELALKQIEKQFGKGSIMKLGDEGDHSVEVIPTGSLALDIALGIGGYPRGRIIEVYGPESSGKTTLTLHAMASAQKAGGTVAFIDAEHALDPTYAKALGVDLNNLVLSQPDTGEQALDIAEALIKSGSIDMIVVDSVAALVPEQEIAGDMSANHVGLQARMMSQAMRKLSGVISKTNVVAIFINQIREKVGIMFGNPETTPGGRALKFFSSVRLEIRRAEALKAGNDMVGIRSNVKVVKSKVAPPLKVAAIDILYGTGISRSGEILDLATDLEFVNKSGAWYNIGDEKLGQGRENARAYLESKPELLDELENKILAHYNIKK